MSDTAPRNSTAAPRMLADALLRTAAGSEARLRVTPPGSGGSMSEVGLVATTFAEVALSPVVMRKMRPGWQQGGDSKWELLVSATSVDERVQALDITDARSLFAMTLAVIVAGQEYLIESIAANEAFGQIYLYRLLLREAQQQAV